MKESSTELDIWPYLQRLTSDVISHTAFGSNYEEGRKIFELQKEQAEHVIIKLLAPYIFRDGGNMMSFFHSLSMYC